MSFYNFGQKGPFLWLYMAIKFELLLVITFMAFYDCVGTLLKINFPSELHANQSKRI